MNNIIKDFEQHQIVMLNNSSATAKSYCSDVKLALDSIGKTMETVEFVDLYDYMMSLSKFASSSRARKVIALKAFYSWACKMELASHNPAAELDTPKIHIKEKEPLTAEKAAELIKQAGKSQRNGARDKAIITLMLSTGARVDEVARLDVADFEKAKSNENILELFGKGRKTRRIGLSAETAKTIDRYLGIRRPSEIPALFLSERGERIANRTIQRVVELCGEACDVDISAHVLRHTFATVNAKRGLDVKTLQKVLGHSSITTTSVYMHTDDERIREAALDFTDPLEFVDTSEFAREFTEIVA